MKTEYRNKNYLLLMLLCICFLAFIPSVITQSAGKITLKCSKAYIEEGDTFQIIMQNIPKDALKQQIQWSVTNNGYFDQMAKYLKNGTFKALNSGTATITAYNKVTKKTYKIDVKIQEPLGKFRIESDNEKASTITLFPGGRSIVNTVLDSKYSYKESVEVVYSIDNTAIAEVDKRGQLKGKKSGTATLKATALNGKSVTCKVSVTSEAEKYSMEKFYADKSLNSIRGGNYAGSNWASADQTYFFPLNSGGFCVIQRISGDESKQQSLFISSYNQEGSSMSKKTVSLPYSDWGGIYQAEDGFYYAAVGQSNKEEDENKIVYCILKLNSSFEEIGRCNVTGYQCNTTTPFDYAAGDMVMSGKILILYTSRVRNTSADGLNHQSNMTIMIDTDTMQQQYVSEPFPYNHISHSFRQFVKMDGDNLTYVDHGDAYPRSVSMTTHYNYPAFDWSALESSNPYIEKLNLINIKGRVGDNKTGTEVSGFEIGDNHNLIAGVSIPHDRITDEQFYDKSLSLLSKNVYVSLVSKDGSTSEIKWLTNYQGGSGISASNLRIVKLSSDRFAVVYNIEQKENKTGIIIIDSNGTVEMRKEYNTYFSGRVQPIYCNENLIWIENINTENGKIEEKCVFIKVSVRP